MKLLIDTNIYIPLEPTSPSELTAVSSLAAKLAELAARTSTQLWLHPAQRVDIAQDRELVRRRGRELLFDKYPVLNLPLSGQPEQRTNDWVDEQLVSALRSNAVTALVTEDKRLTKRAVQELGPERVLTLADAIASLSALLDQPVEPPPSVESVAAYSLNGKDPFWDSFRAQYEGFDRWFARCQQEHRQSWMIRAPDGQGIAGAAIVNPELQEVRGKKTLKICSLKVDSAHSGRRYGELLLKTIFHYAYQNGFDTLFITAFPEHQQLIALLLEFGFREDESSRTNSELSFTKHLDRSDPQSPTVDPLAFFVDRGPFVIDLYGPLAFLVPILPVYHRMLFPELQQQLPLTHASQAYGNSLRKAYLSSSPITLLQPGAVLYFYRSDDARAVNAWGVVEEVLRSESADEIGGFVLPRTVYSGVEIKRMCSRGPVLAIMFRQILRRIEPQISFRMMRAGGALNGPPQSITKLAPKGQEWMRNQCQKLS